MKRLLAAALLVASPAYAQQPNLIDWLKDHASVVSGVSVANGQKAEFVSLAINTTFEVKPRLKAFGGLSLFSRSRVTSEGTEASALPFSLTDLAIYSSGEAMGGAWFEWTEIVGVECRGGITFEMIALTGHDVGAPIDGSKYLGACGLRLTGGPGRISILAGHYGTVTEGSEFWVIPSLIVSGEFRHKDNLAFLVDIAAGRERVTQKAHTEARFAVKYGFR